jgi:hypothetical protein
MLNDLSSMFEMGTGTNYSQATKYWNAGVMPCKVTNIIICTYEPIARVIGSTFNPTSYIVKNISIDYRGIGKKWKHC